MDRLHPHDSRVKWCDREGCGERAEDGRMAVFSEQRTFYYCSYECEKEHAEFLKRHIREMGS